MVLPHSNDLLGLVITERLFATPNGRHEKRRHNKMEQNELTDPYVTTI